MKNLIKSSGFKYFLIALIITLTGLFSYFSIKGTLAEQTPLTPTSTIIKLDRKIVANIQDMTISMYRDNELVESLPIDSNSRPLVYLSSGEYSSQHLQLLNLDERVLDFAKKTSDFFVINPNGKTQSGLDEQSLYFLKNEKSSFPKLSAKAFLVADLESGAIIKEKDKDKKMPIASISKIMTALVALEDLDQNKYIKITKEMLSKGYGSYGNLRRGEELKVSEIIYPLLLASSNDAAYVLSMDHGQEKFMKLMNDKAASIGLTQTFYEEPSGISPNNISTTVDLFKLTQHIYENKKWIFDITSLKTINSWRNNNFFAGKKDYLGGKNGYIDESRETSIGIFSLELSNPENRKIAIIILNSQDRETDALAILKWLKANVAYLGEVHPKKAFSQDEAAYFEKGLQTISLLFTGDIMMNRNVTDSVLTQANGDFSYLFENASFIKNADITFGNLKGPISDAGRSTKGADAIRMHPVTAKTLEQAGVDIVSVANNFIGDWGRTAFEDTLFRLKNDGVLTAGGGLTMEEAVEPVIIEKQGVNIGFISFSDAGPNWLDVSNEESGILAVDNLFSKRIKNSSQKSDVLVVSLSFDENVEKQRQEKISKQAIDSGANIVIGYHPGNPQGVEEYNGGVIAYNLGDFISDEISSSAIDGIVLEVKISGNGNIKSTNKLPIKINEFYQPEVVK